eukprot:snap_masked-scaffold_22-processed-gene-0.18-mRNA-1 protein AED:1.00 eAED:1.00 QI:0/0/0/0/1/1/2/0/61
MADMQGLSKTVLKFCLSKHILWSHVNKRPSKIFNNTSKTGNPHILTINSPASKIMKTEQME